MKNCKDMEDKLSLYMDDGLSADDKHRVEKHLKTCAQCKQVLAKLQKVKAMTGQLSEVETPPWFKQKIMTQVRKEAEKKGFAEKWFYPLRIKVPVQIFATIFIVVIAVYIYRAGNEQFKEVMPPTATAPMMEEQTEQTPLKKDLSRKENERVASKGSSADTVCDEKSCKVEGQVFYDRAEEKVSPSVNGKSEIPASPAAIQAADKEIAADTFEVKSQRLRAPMEKSVGSVQLKQENNIIIRTSNVQGAAAQVEKLLAKYNAAKISKQTKDDKVVFRAEISKEKLNDFIEKLKTIGLVEEKETPAISNEGYISVVIEIQNQKF